MTARVTSYRTELTPDVVDDLLELLRDHRPVDNPGGDPLCSECGDYWHECPVKALNDAAR